jgi:serpin B
MGVAFDRPRANFQDMLAGPSWIDKVRHKTFVQVDEQGTEAAAATGVAMGRGAPPPEFFRMVVDRPFFCAIRDDPSGALLFMGSIVEPM